MLQAALCLAFYGFLSSEFTTLSWGTFNLAIHATTADVSSSTSVLCPASVYSCVSKGLAHSCVSAASAHSCVNEDGISVGCPSACGAKEDIGLPDKSSAMPFFLPGTCNRATMKLWSEANRNRRRKRLAICGCFTDFLCQAFTMASLSQ